MSANGLSALVAGEREARQLPNAIERINEPIRPAAGQDQDEQNAERVAPMFATAKPATCWENETRVAHKPVVVGDERHAADPA